ncbi:hypothetical protein Cni_G02295 [Canna indica]|uniref:DUF7866 domain-containing protein n=1 Tax=Canna indica TaxID=4628 RepID=A0AAQ3Q220_9LILI|nr:hypothetical protein Cni_G02295 [Canna indica]
MAAAGGSRVQLGGAGSPLPSSWSLSTTTASNKRSAEDSQEGDWEEGVVEASANEYYIPATTFVEHQPAKVVVPTALKVCGSCRCCAKDDRNNCKDMQCCHEFRCQPSGKCSFTPISCDCNNCSDKLV